MNCRNARGLFSPSLDAALSYEERRRLDNHLKDCPACRGEYAKLRQTVAWVRDLPEIRGDEGFVERVLAAARSAETGRPAPVREPGYWEKVKAGISALEWSLSPRVAAGALALGLMVGVAGSMLILRGPDSREATAPVAEVNRTLPAAPGAGDPAGASSPVAETPVPGSIGDLVDQMVRRMEADASAGGDSVAAGDPEWAPTRGPSAGGRVVGSEVPAQGQSQERGGRVYIVF